MRGSTESSHRSRLARAIVLLMGASVMLIGAPAPGVDHQQFYGIIHVIPSGKFGTWHIGYRTVTSDEFTQIEAYQAPLSIGSCARVVTRRDVAQSIITAPMRRCETKRDEHIGVGS